MDSGEEDRGVSELAGAILIFAAIIITLSVYQATVVPIQNERVEFNHNLDVHAEMQELRQAILNVPESGGSETVTLELGVRYPSRAILVNPAPAVGTLETEGTSVGEPNMSISNAATTGEVGDFWNGDPHEYATGAVVYRPGYNQYTDAPTTNYENSVAYNRFDDTEIPLTDQSIVDGRRITLTAVGGNLSRNAVGETSVDVRSTSPGLRTVAVSDEGGNVTVSVPTKLDLATWQDLLEDELVANGGHVVGVSMNPIADSEFDRLTVEFEQGVTYELRLAKVTVGESDEQSEVGYVTTVSRNVSSMTTNETKLLVAEVRDRFDNPVSGVAVTFTTDHGNFSNGADTIEVTSDEKGQASVVLSASTDGEATVMAGIEDGDGDLTEPPELGVTFTVFVQSS